MDLDNQKCISLETYRRNGRAVRTPVWFVPEDGLVYVVTRSRTGKARRLRNNKRVRIAACTMRGSVTGGWASGTARILSEKEAARVSRLRDSRYGLLARAARLLSRGKGDLFALAITLEE